MSSVFPKSEMRRCLKEIMKQNHIENFELIEEGNAAFGTGFLGDILFATINIENKHEIPIVIKLSKVNKTLRAETSITILSMREIRFYKTIIPAYEGLVQEKHIAEKITSVPKFFGASVSDIGELLVLENVSKKGYKMWPKNISLTLQHTRAVLREYGKMHGLSFALKDQKPELFREITHDMSFLFGRMITEFGFYDVVTWAYNQALLIAKEFGNDETDRFKEIGKKIEEFITTVKFEEEDYLAISHGDCWNNNFLFNYETGNEESPKSVIIIDWQACSLTPPVIDLCHFLYTTSNKDQFDVFDQLLDFYYQTLSEQIKKLGSDPGIYPYEKFKEQWNKYSFYGAFLASGHTMYGISDVKEGGPTVESVVEGGTKFNSGLYDDDIIENPECRKRLVNLVEHFCKFKYL